MKGFYQVLLEPEKEKQLKWQTVKAVGLILLTVLASITCIYLLSLPLTLMNFLKTQFVVSFLVYSITYLRNKNNK